MQTFAISSTKRCTIGLPATGIKGFGIDKVCGRIRFPIPAIGIINFISYLIFYYYLTPVCPNPPSPRTVSESSLTSINSAFAYSAITI